jgi:hypothetical protein
MRVAIILALGYLPSIIFASGHRVSELLQLTPKGLIEEELTECNQFYKMDQDHEMSTKGEIRATVASMN